MSRQAFWRSRVFRWASLGGCCVGVLLLGLCLERRHEHELSRLLGTLQCAPLSLRDRFGLPLAELKSACPGRGHATQLEAVPRLLRQLVITSEDRRFEQHHGLDFPAIVRALRSNLRARRVVSGASTLTMQLARLLRATPHTRALPAKLLQAWDALTLERMLTKSQILEAYFNAAYYGASAYGVADAARTYFGRELAALDDAELALLALLPRAPEVYNLKRHPERALRRREELVDLWLAQGVLQPEQARVMQQSSLRLAAAVTAAASHAQHFVVWTAGELPAAERQRGGVLHTTLDLRLQQTLEGLVQQHVDKLANQGVDEAALVVLDTRSAEVRALVGSYAFERSQINAVTRRRQLGSLLKPFVYGLAIEQGATPESIAADVGDVPSAYRSRDWVGQEAGPLSYREALAGSYNLAAVHVLERVGVSALHQLLRRAGVAELASAPQRYGLPLALGSARVRLLDVAAGYGFIARSGLVRRASSQVRLERPDGSVWRPEAVRDVALFSGRTSAQVADILSDPAARHRRFGRGLPLDRTSVADLGESEIALKTGTASGMADLSAILVSSDFTVAAWSGRFDGQPSHGLSGMWGALPLARRALHAALSGHTPQLAAGAKLASVGEPKPANAPLDSVASVNAAKPAVAPLDSVPSAGPVSPTNTPRDSVASKPVLAPPRAAGLSGTDFAPWAERARTQVNGRVHAR